MLVFSKFYYIFDKIIGRKAIILPIILVFGFIFGFFCHKLLNDKVIFDAPTASLKINYNRQNPLFRSDLDFLDEFYAHSDNFESFFDEFSKVEEEFDKFLATQRSFFRKIASQHNSNLKINSGDKSEITKIDKDNSVTYQLNFDGFNQDEINIEIQKNKLTIKADKKDKKDNSYSSSSFLYSFYIDEKFDHKNPEIVRNKNNITIKFNKK